jgi:hypothetical protein
LDYGFALPAGRPVGRLVTETPPSETARTTVEASPGALPAPAPAGSQAAGQSWTARSQGANRLVPVALWTGLAIVVLTVLSALVARQRHR